MSTFELSNFYKLCYDFVLQRIYVVVLCEIAYSEQYNIHFFLLCKKKKLLHILQGVCERKRRAVPVGN